MRLLSWIIMVPVALAVVTFSVNNRDAVAVDLWPVLPPFDVPLFAVVLVTFLAALLVGAVIAWLSGGKSRSRGRANARRATTAEREVAIQKERIGEMEPAVAPSENSLPARIDAA